MTPGDGSCARRRATSTKNPRAARWASSTSSGGVSTGNASSPAAWSRAASEWGSWRCGGGGEHRLDHVVVARFRRAGGDESVHAEDIGQRVRRRTRRRAGAPATRRRPRPGTPPAPRRTGIGCRGVRARDRRPTRAGGPHRSAPCRPRAATGRTTHPHRARRARADRGARRGHRPDRRRRRATCVRAAAARRRRTRCAPRSTTPLRWSARTTAGPTTDRCCRSRRATRTRAAGFAAHSSGAPSPKPSITPGRKFSTRTSDSSASRRARLAARVGPQVEHDALLVAVHLVVEVVHHHLGGVRRRVGFTSRLRALDPDDPGSQVGQHPGRARARPRTR